MTIAGVNRLRKQSGRQAVRDFQSQESEYMGLQPPTEVEIRERAFAVYLKRVQLGLPGDADVDWRVAETELRTM